MNMYLTSRTYKAIFALAGLLVLGLTYALMLFLAMWVDPHHHFDFIFPVKNAGEAWSVCWRISFSLIGLTSVVFSFWYGAKRIFTK